jgi:hypothetical protein
MPESILANKERITNSKLDFISTTIPKIINAIILRVTPISIIIFLPSSFIVFPKIKENKIPIKGYDAKIYPI